VTEFFRSGADATTRTRVALGLWKGHDLPEAIKTASVAIVKAALPEF